EIVEHKPGLASDLLECAPGKVYATGLAFILDAGCDIDAVAEDVVAVDNDVAHVDANAEDNLWPGAALTLRHLGLHAHRAVDSIDGTSELHQHAVAGRLYGPAVMLGDCRIDDLAPQGLQHREGANLVGAHQPGITRDIGRQDRG